MIEIGPSVASQRKKDPRRTKGQIVKIRVKQVKCICYPGWCSIIGEAEDCRDLGVYAKPKGSGFSILAGWCHAVTS